MAKKKEQSMRLPKPISDYSDANPLIPPAQMVRFQDGRNAGLKEAAALIEGTEPESAKKIRGLLFHDSPLAKEGEPI